LFDAVACIIGLRKEVSFEAQAAIELESLAIDKPVKKGYNFDIVLNKTGDSVVEPALINSKPVLEGILKDLSSGVDTGVISAKFHLGVAQLICDLARLFGKKTGIKDVALSGGVFQNKVLLELAVKGLERSGFRAHFNTLVPPNDGGISLGQAYLAAISNI
jgi:hydrogenase maturation protein HypF